MSSMITDLDIQALVDGEKEGSEKSNLLKTLENSPDLYRRYLQYKKQKILLQMWWKEN